MPVLHEKLKRVERFRSQLDRLGTNRETPKVHIKLELADADDGPISPICIGSHTDFVQAFTGFSALRVESAWKTIESAEP